MFLNGRDSMPIYAGFSLTKAGEPKKNLEYTLFVTRLILKRVIKGGNLTIKTNHPVSVK